MNKGKKIVAIAVFITVVVLSLSYGIGKTEKGYVFEEETMSVNKEGNVTHTVATVVSTTMTGNYANRKEAKREYDEISKLRDADNYEKALKKEWVENGIKLRLYQVSYTLSNGKVITMRECDASSASIKPKN